MSIIHFLKTDVVPNYTNDVIELAEGLSLLSFSFDLELSEIKSMKVKLMEDPENSLADFNILYSKIQSYQSRITSILIDILEEKSTWQRWNRKANAIYKKGKNFLLSTNEDIKKLRNKEMQEAYIDNMLPELVKLKDSIDDVLEDIDSLKDIVYEKKEEMDKVNTNISRQQRVVESMIGLGYPVIAKTDNRK
jgi:septal ring factor EnvC (AmiA/AmiB activator)